jgi:hypothetical protein
VSIDIENENINDMSQTYWDTHIKMMAENNPLEVAAILMAHSLTLYKTMLSSEDYDEMIESISSLKDQIKTINPHPGYYQ